MKITYLPQPETEIMPLMFTIVIITRIKSFFFHSHLNMLKLITFKTIDIKYEVEACYMVRRAPPVLTRAADAHACTRAARALVLRNRIEIATFFLENRIEF